MKKNWIKRVVFSAMVLLGASNVMAQKSYTAPALNPEYAAMADQVIEMQLSDPDEANKIFTKLLRKIRNSKEDLLSVGDYFLQKNVYPCANQCSSQLYTIAPQYLEGLMFAGEVCMLRKDYGAAGQKFDEALAIDSTYIPALKRNAFVYKNVNPYVAIETLQKIKVVDPTNHVADRDLGDIYYNLNEFKDAVNSYKTYFTAVTQNDSSDIRSAENYMQSLYATQNFEDLSANVDRFAALDSKDMVFKRMKFFAAVENIANTLDMTAAQAQAKDAMGYITNKEYPDSFYLYLDYSYASNLMNEMDSLSAAISYQEKAIERDGTKVNGLKQLATLYRRDKQYDQAIATYKRYITTLGDKVQNKDLFELGQRYYLPASQQKDIAAEKKAEYVKEGDAIFVEILTKQPDFYQAMLMRAAINITDGTKPEDNVKALYEEALKLMEGKEGVENGKVQALTYLAFYCVQKDLLDEARNYTNQILAINPEHATAKNIDSYLKSVNK